MEEVTLYEAILAVLDEGPEMGKSISKTLRERGFRGSCDPSSVNRLLYRMEREGRVRMLASRPPIWALVRTSPKTSVNTSNHASKNSSLRPPTGDSAPAQSKSQAKGPASSDDPVRNAVWEAALKILADQGKRGLRALVIDVSRATGLYPGLIREHLAAGFAGIESDGRLFEIRPKERLALTLRAYLPGLALTPAGNPRPGSLLIDASGPQGRLSARIEVVDDELPFWFCLPARSRKEWNALREGAETTSGSWSLPWRRATEPAPLPAPLAWRSGKLDQVIRAASRASTALNLPTFDSVAVTALKPEKAPQDSVAREDQVIQRLTRRRGTIPSGRKYPIMGSCDRCGHALSDPYSLLVGVGPECRKYYSRRVLAAVATASGPAGGGPTYLGGAPADAVARLAAAWTQPVI